MTIDEIGIWIAAISSIILLVLEIYSRVIKPKSDIKIEMRKLGMVYYLELYSKVAMLTDRIGAYQKAKQDGHCGVLTEQGFLFFNQDEIYQQFKELHKKFTEFLYSSKTKGHEYYLSKNIANKLINFAASSLTLYENSDLDVEKLKNLFEEGNEITSEIEKMTGID